MLKKMLLLCFAFSICACTLGTTGCSDDKGPAVKKEAPAKPNVEKAPRKKMLAPPN